MQRAFICQQSGSAARAKLKRKKTIQFDDFVEVKSKGRMERELPSRRQDA